MIEYKIPTKDGVLATYKKGQGKPLLFLHGGPGDTHNYLRKVISPLLSEYECILYDQRGTGGSTLKEPNERTLHVSQFFEDIKAIQNHFKLGKLTLVGHSWGAMLGLFFNIAYPDQVDQLALLNLGPLDAEMERACNSNLMIPLNQSEREEWKSLRGQRSKAITAGDESQISKINHRLMELRVKAWVYDPLKRDLFLKEYFSEPPVNSTVAQMIWSSIEGSFKWDDVRKIKNSFWFVWDNRIIYLFNKDIRFESKHLKLKSQLFPNAVICRTSNSPILFMKS